MLNTIRELKFAARALAKRPCYWTAAVTTLALGIGANVAIFTVVNAVLLQPLPYPRRRSHRHHSPPCAGDQPARAAKLTRVD